MNILDMLRGRESEHTEEDYLALQRDNERLWSEVIKLQKEKKECTIEVGYARDLLETERARHRQSEQAVESRVAVATQVLEVDLRREREKTRRLERDVAVMSDDLEAIRARLERGAGSAVARAITGSRDERVVAIRELAQGGASIRGIQRAVFGNCGAWSFYKVKGILAECS